MIAFLRNVWVQNSRTGLQGCMHAVYRCEVGLVLSFFLLHLVQWRSGVQQASGSRDSRDFPASPANP